MTMFKGFLVVAGYQYDDDTWNYHILKDPRGSLLAANWTTVSTRGDAAPNHHVSYTFGRSMVLLGGSLKSPLKIDLERVENGTVLNINILYNKTTNFTRTLHRSCSFQLDTRNQMVIGGEDRNGHVQAAVLTFDKSNDRVSEHPPIKIPRSGHSCGRINNTHILVTGGTNNTGDLMPSEIYDLISEVSDIITDQNKEMKTKRQDHKLMQLGQELYAFGGLNASGDPVKVVEKYDASLGTWSELDELLLSTSTGGIAATEFPQSSLDCDEGCKCGKRKEDRIVNGEPTEVRRAVVE